ncbi:MAG: hypothetical protein MMC33_003143 [Icmadophila ericetorum]|nr:hypothetical protein [Icmadophila ericetorum]
MATETVSPPTSMPSSPKSSQSPMRMSLDLSNLPPLIHPSPPTNTLLITNLDDPSIFHPANLLTLRSLIEKTAPIHHWSPLKSFRRILVSFLNIEAAISVRQLLDGEAILSSRIRIYFGEATPVDPLPDQHLQAPKSQKLFFISPPPSPPHGWEVRNEGPPNKDVVAEDLASALAKLRERPDTVFKEPNSPVSPTREGEAKEGRRNRSGSTTVVYHPEDHGDSPHLPAVMVEDTTMSDEEELEGQGEGEVKILAHTARPPVELMADA